VTGNPSVESDSASRAAFSSSGDKQRLPLQLRALYLRFGVRDLARGFVLIMGIILLNARALVEIYGINARRASKLRAYPKLAG